jgi:hypothetical protein
MLREEHRLKMFENRILRRIFGSKRDRIIGGWRKDPIHITIFIQYRNSVPSEA